MTRPVVRPYSGVLLFTFLGVCCLGLIVARKPDANKAPIQPPPSTFNLDEVTYLLSPSSKHKSQFFKSRSVSGPCTVVRTSSPQLTSEDLAEIQKAFSQDDVWTSRFFENTVVLSQQSHQRVKVSSAAQKLLEAWGTRLLSTEDFGILDAPSGPYFCNSGQLHNVYRLFPDTAEAFMSATIQSESDPYLYDYLNTSIFGQEYPSVLTLAVPSRLHFTPTTEQPLAGLRIAVKDTQDLRGIKTTGSSRAWARLYGPSEQSATGVQRLLQKGAVVIGKLKSTQFGESEWATRDWVDYHAPWNPRGDGYQTPSASSSGSGTAVAAYPWLDLSTGTDCSGSVRAPAAVHGIYGIRPSTDAIDNQGVIPFSKNFDTFGIFTRNIDTLALASSVLYNLNAEISSCFKKPTRILYLSEYWPVQDEASSSLFESTIEKLEDNLGVIRTRLSLAETWSETNTVGTKLSIDDYFNTTFVTASSPDQWDMISKFRAEYESAFGHAPPLNPQLQWKLKFLPSQTVERQKQGEKEVQVFRGWFEKHVMQADENGCSETILVLPWTNGKPSYRDEYGERPNWTGEGWFFYFISVYAGAPEIILPIGQTSYQSRLTNREEWLPAAMGIVGARGTDVAFTSFLKEILIATKLPSKVDVGQTAFKPTTLSVGVVVTPTEKSPLHQEMK